MTQTPYIPVHYFTSFFLSHTSRHIITFPFSIRRHLSPSNSHPPRLLLPLLKNLSHQYTVLLTPLPLRAQLSNLIYLLLRRLYLLRVRERHQLL